MCTRRHPGPQPAATTHAVRRQPARPRHAPDAMLVIDNGSTRRDGRVAGVAARDPLACATPSTSAAAAPGRRARCSPTPTGSCCSTTTSSPARHRREASRDSRRGGRHLVPHPRRLPPAARDRPGGVARRRDRRRLHRVGDRSRARRQRLQGHDALSGARDRLPPLPARTVAVRRGVLPGEGRRRAHRAAGRIRLGQPRRDRIRPHLRG